MADDPWQGTERQEEYVVRTMEWLREQDKPVSGWCIQEIVRGEVEVRRCLAAMNDLEAVGAKP